MEPLAVSHRVTQTCGAKSHSGPVVREQGGNAVVSAVLSGSLWSHVFFPYFNKGFSAALLDDATQKDYLFKYVTSYFLLLSACTA